MRRAPTMAFVAAFALLLPLTHGDLLAQNPVQVTESTILEAHGLVGSHMVLQRGVKLTIPGKTAPHATVKADFAGSTATAKADRHGRFTVVLPPQTAGGPHDLILSIPGEPPIIYEDILIGDVWVCSGQSNMQWAVRQADHAAAEIAAADHPRIRHFTVARNPSADRVQPDVSGQWQPVRPDTIADFSAVGYYFGRAVHRETGVPIGLIDNAWGGMPAEAYSSRESLLANADLAHMIHQSDQALADYPRQLKAYQQKLAQRNANALKPARNFNKTKNWQSADFDDAKWKKMKLPSTWEARGQQWDGSVWFRKTVNVPAGWAGKPLTLSLGPIDDFDTTFFNGTKVGATGAETPNSWSVPRVYTVPGELVKPGNSTIAVRVFDGASGGGIHGQPAQMTLKIKGETTTQPINLAGQWSYRPESVTAPINARPPLGPKNPRAPAALYQGMTVALGDLPITGVIWYQGEANAGRAHQYRTLFPLMIKDWRKLWGNDRMPFFFVQLANFRAPQTDPNERSEWPELREAQTMTLSLPNTGQAVIIDVGAAHDIHPRDKQTVGHRLALIARAKHYGEKIVYAGPMYKAMKRQGNRVTLTFDHVGSGLVTKGDALKGFAVAGDDRVFHWASAKINADHTVTVWSDAVAQPVAVRYGWANNPAVTLYNKEGLPACPFRTDDWPMVTRGNK